MLPKHQQRIRYFCRVRILDRLIGSNRRVRDFGTGPSEGALWLQLHISRTSFAGGQLKKDQTVWSESMARPLHRQAPQREPRRRTKATTTTRVRLRRQRHGIWRPITSLIDVDSTWTPTVLRLER